MTRAFVFLLGVAGIVSLFVVTSCGYSSRNNEAIGQVKKVVNLNPLICPERVVVDISLGVMRNGVGSMSTEDSWLYVPPEHAEKLRAAAETGQLVKIRYDVPRFVWCKENHQISAVEFVK